MINAPEYRDVFARFRSAYEYRKQFPWLEESKKDRNGDNQDGLAYALRAALATYIVNESAQTGGRGAQVKSLDIQEGTQFDFEWTSALMTAITTTIEEGFSLERFENRLSRAEGNVDIISPNLLRKHIVAALDNYSAHRMIGLSPDPF